MSSKRWTVVAGLTLGTASLPALATPHENVTFTNVASEGHEGDAVNQVRDHTFTGGYAVGHVRVTATLTEIATATYASEAQISVTPPGGIPFLIAPFSDAGFTGSISVTDRSVRVAPAVSLSAGPWSFRFFETFLDATTGPDATWDSISLTLDDDVSLPPGDMPDTAAVPQGTGTLNSVGDELAAGGNPQMYRIQICQPSNFSATTIGGTGVDSVLALFDANAVGIAYSDQSGGTDQSTISSAFTASLPVGDYYLAVFEWDTAAYDAQGQRIWEDAPWDVERAPDGPGAANPLASWAPSTFSSGGLYTITLTGACFVGPTFNCVADVDDGTGTGTRDGAVTVDDLLFFLGAFEAGSSRADVDNGTSTGTTDGAVTIEDLLYYLVRFEAGC